MSNSEATIVLKTSDGAKFTVDKAVALQSQTLARSIEDCGQYEIPIANLTSKDLPKLLEYCEKHVGDANSEEKKKELTEWDAEFMKNNDNSTIFDLILASNYLEIKSLLDLACQTIADRIANCKDANEIRDKFEIENDFLDGEEEAVRKENQWAFE